jgi:hypothetical protein
MGRKEMLFMIQATHDYSTCQTHHPTKGPLYKETLANLGDHGLKVHHVYGNRMEHKQFIICEADTMEQLDAAFDPILELGQYTVTPVIER